MDEFLPQCFKKTKVGIYIYTNINLSMKFKNDTIETLFDPNPKAHQRGPSQGNSGNDEDCTLGFGSPASMSGIATDYVGYLPYCPEEESQDTLTRLSGQR